MKPEAPMQIVADEHSIDSKIQFRWYDVIVASWFKHLHGSKRMYTWMMFVEVSWNINIPSPPRDPLVPSVTRAPETVILHLSYTGPTEIRRYDSPPSSLLQPPMQCIYHANQWSIWEGALIGPCSLWSEKIINHVHRKKQETWFAPSVKNNKLP